MKTVEERKKELFKMIENRKERVYDNVEKKQQHIDEAYTELGQLVFESEYAFKFRREYMKR